MKIGVPKEIKNHEYRVGIVPAGVHALVARGHEVIIERQAGARIGFSDAMYRDAGARVVDDAGEVYACPMIVKVKEPQAGEYALLQEGQVLFTYLHLASDPEQTRQLLARGIVGIAYETVTDERKRLPLLTPMSEVAGRLSIQAGAGALYLANGGNGVLLGGVPGVPPARVLVIGGGVVGTQAAKMAVGLGADVTILDNSLDRLRELDDIFNSRLKTRYSDAYAIAEETRAADLVIGAVLIAGKRAPKLISADHIRHMKPGAVLVDVAIDQGGCAETSRPTSHSQPIYTEHGVVHYCVTNMPGACARTSTLALTNATLPYVMELADKGYQQALLANRGLMNGLNLFRGMVTHRSVAEDLGYDYVSPSAVLGGDLSGVAAA